MNFPAHIKVEESQKERIQTVEQHCRNCAHYAAAAAPDGLKQLCYLAGLLHDMGKYTEKFKVYITAAARGESVRRGSVNHTFASVRFIFNRWHRDSGQTLHNMTAELLAFACGSHHGQFDCVSLEGKDGYLHRLEAEGVDYEEAVENYLRYCASPEELDRLFEEAEQEVVRAQKLLFGCSKTKEEIYFYFSLIARMALSAVIEGDRRDTAEFDQGHALPQQETEPDWDALLSRVEEKLSDFRADSEINRARKHISDLCREAASRGGGIFRLNVPTGGGKTLSALRYALARAAEGQTRVFFVIPLLSILEQNAAVIREYLDDPKLILEHHSNVIREKPDKKEIEELDETELVLENWRAPVVITTLVQLLNTLFDGKTSCIRRMTALCGSVIVIDEVQSVPRKMLSQFNLALNFLATFCGATVVLCSATQPCLDQTDHGLRYAEQPELVPYDETLWRVFRRTELTDLRKSLTVEELAAFALERQQEAGSVLVICNTKSEARKIFEAIQSQYSGLLYHLSTSMCTDHRKQTLKGITDALNHKPPIPVLCVSTQLVEAGVDFSFGCVIRIAAGMDNVVQAAGRCNRSGEFERICPVYIVRLRGENLGRLPEIRQAQQAAECMLLQFQQDPQKFDCDPTGREAIKTYYQDLYAEMTQGSQDYPLPKLKTSLFQLLSCNGQAEGHCDTASRYLLVQGFRTAGEQFRVFEDNTVDVVTPYGEGKKLIEALGSQFAVWNLEERRKLLRDASRFTISLYEYERKKLADCGGIYSLYGGEILVLQPGFYSDQTGLTSYGDVNLFEEV